MTDIERNQPGNRNQSEENNPNGFPDGEAWEREQARLNESGRTRADVERDREALRQAGLDQLIIIQTNDRT